MGWKLAAGTGYCETGGDVVFLDLTRDRYLALRGDERAAFERLRKGEPNDSDAMGRLVATGLIARCEGTTQIVPTRVPVPMRDLAANDARSSLLMALRAGAALRWARRAMRPKRLDRSIEAMAARKRELGVPGAERPVRDIAATYAASRWLVPAKPRCLIDALALDHILLARRLSATLVFGVHLKPFAAHCWLQSPEVVLTGTAAEARNFTPILVVG